MIRDIRSGLGVRLERPARVRARRRARVDRGRAPGAGRALRRRQEHACCARSPALQRPTAAGWTLGDEVWLDSERRHRPAAGAPALRLRVPGLRAVPAPERLAERRLRARGQSRAPSARPRASSCSSSFGVAALADARPGDALGRRAPAGRAGAGARPRPRAPAARRAALGARLAHRAPRPHASWPRPSRGRRRPPCSSPTTSPRRRCSAPEIAVIDRGRIVQRGTAGELSAKPASAFVADFTGATVLLGTARHRTTGTTSVALDGGGES